jgi:hypothetical protein
MTANPTTVAEAAYWCHVCCCTVPASQASTHQHDANAPGK